MKYDNRMDPECVPLCDALNCLPDIITSESCCGHGTSGMSLLFNIRGGGDLQGLFFLTRCTDRRYWKYGDVWSTTLSVGDTIHDGIVPTIFTLASTSGGIEAYNQAKDLVDNMVYHLNHDNFKKGYNLDISKFKVINKNGIFLFDV